MVIYCIFILVIVFSIFIFGVINPLFAYFNEDKKIKFNGTIYDELNEEKFKKILFAIFLNLIILLLVLLAICLNFSIFKYVFFLIIGIILWQRKILKPLKHKS
ncbi:MAG: hypothetical protein KH323_05505 [Veillonella sp.]|nr:hypothetical protein [Veillonella sp.]